MSKIKGDERMLSTARTVNITSQLQLTPYFKICRGQDGAIYGDWLFRFETNGSCFVFSIQEQKQVAQFCLDKTDLLRPHSNAVAFGAERYDEADEFPLLYTNIYNNYAKQDERLEGVCCVYRITRDGDTFASSLVQVIRIGFVEDLELWKSLPDRGDVRPYGNFVPDVFRDKLYAFVMRDRELVTRYFSFRLPKLAEGVFCEQWGVKVVTLQKEDIQSRFDDEYMHYMQGACAYDGKIYSSEGFSMKTPDQVNRPGIRVIDMDAGKQLQYFDLYALGKELEAEMMDFAGDTLYYMDVDGNAYAVSFEEETK